MPKAVILCYKSDFISKRSNHIKNWFRRV